MKELTPHDESVLRALQQRGFERVPRSRNWWTFEVREGFQLSAITLRKKRWTWTATLHQSSLDGSQTYLGTGPTVLVALDELAVAVTRVTNKARRLLRAARRRT